VLIIECLTRVVHHSSRILITLKESTWKSCIVASLQGLQLRHVNENVILQETYKEGQVEDPSQPIVACHGVTSTNENHRCNLISCLVQAGQAIHKVAPIAVTNQDHSAVALQTSEHSSIEILMLYYGILDCSPPGTILSPPTRHRKDRAPWYP